MLGKAWRVGALTVLVLVFGASSAHAAATCTVSGGALTATSTASEATLVLHQASTSTVSEPTNNAAATCPSIAGITSIRLLHSASTGSISLVTDFSLRGIATDIQTRPSFDSPTIYPSVNQYLQFQAVTTPIGARLGHNATSGRNVIDLYDPSLSPDGTTDITLEGANASSIVTGTANDTVDFSGYGSNTQITSYFDVDPGLGNDTIVDPINYYSSAGNDTISAPTCSTTLSMYFTDDSQAVRIKPDFSGTETGFNGNGGTDTFTAGLAACPSIAINGSPQNDILYTRTTGTHSDALSGGAGADQLYALNGRGGDQLSCGTGDTGTRDRADTATGCSFQPPAVDVAGPASPINEGTTANLTVSLPGGALPFAINGALKLAGNATPPDGRTTVPYTIAAGATSVQVPITVPDDTIAQGQRAYGYLDDGATSPTPRAGTTGTLTVAADNDVPTVAITTTPGAADGDSGWFRSATYRVVAGNVSGGSVRCVVDPAGAPTSFADLPSSSCPAALTSQALAEGAHTIYAAVQGDNGQASPVATQTVKVDRTPPAVTCDAAPTVNVGQPTAIGATVTDAVSGAVDAHPTAAVDTSSAGAHTATVTGRDVAGSSATATCTVNVVAAQAATTTTPSTAKPAPVTNALFCNGVQVVIQPVLSGKTATITGLARTTLAGKKVTLKLGSKSVGSTTIGADGRFSLKVKAPAKSKLAGAKYRAEVGTVKSVDYVLQRKTVIKGQSASALTGRITAARKLLPKTAEVFRQTTCAKRLKVATVKLAKDGSFKLNLQRATATTGPLIYRVRVKLKNGKTSFTVPITVFPAAR